jgi:uncharacterized membrane protein
MVQNRSHDSLTGILLPSALILGLVLLLAFDMGRVVEGTDMASPREPWLQLIVGYLATGAEIAAALVIGVAIVRAIGVYLFRLVARNEASSDYLASIRLQLGRVLALGLEFTIASDILRTAVSPTRQEIMNLGAIVLLRSLLNYFLEMEISMGEGRSAQMADTGRTQLERGGNQ